MNPPLPKPYIINNLPVTKTELLKMAEAKGYKGKHFNIAAGFLRNKGFKIKHNPNHDRFNQK